MQITQKDLNTFDADIIIDNHINYDEGYILFTLEDEDGKAVCQVLSSHKNWALDVWEVFSAKFPEADDFTLGDTEHRDNCPLFAIEQ